MERAELIWEVLLQIQQQCTNVYKTNLLKNKNLNMLASVGILTPKNKNSMPITIPPYPCICMHDLRSPTAFGSVHFKIAIRANLKYNITFSYIYIHTGLSFFSLGIWKKQNNNKQKRIMLSMLSDKTSLLWMLQ